MNDTTVPDRSAVEFDAQHLREKVAKGSDLYHYAFCYAAAFATTSLISPADAVRRIAEVAAAVEVVEGEQRAASFGYSRTDTEPDDPTPVSPARGGAPHVGAVVGGGALVDETPAAEPVHYRFGMNPTVCGLKPGMVPKASADRRDVTCLDCLDGMPF